MIDAVKPLFELEWKFENGRLVVWLAEDPERQPVATATGSFSVWSKSGKGRATIWVPREK